MSLHPLALHCLLAAILLPAASVLSQTHPDVIVFDEDDVTGIGYYDASVPIVSAPSFVTTFPSPNGGKLPILTNSSISGAQSGLVEWHSAPGGNWTWFIASPGFQTQNLVSYSNLVFFVNGPSSIAAANIPSIGLESSSNQKSSTINLSAYLPAGVDGDTNTWQRVVVPLTAFQPFGAFTLSQFKDVFFTQNAADNVTRTMWLDNLRVTDGHKPAPPAPLVSRSGDRSVSLHWPRNSEPDLLGYRIYRATNTNGPFDLLTTSPITQPIFADVTVTNGGTYYFRVRAINSSWEESLDSNTVLAQPLLFADDSDFLEYLQQSLFDFFYYEANPTNGLVRDRSQQGSLCSIAAVGFGLSGICIAVDHGWITREEGRSRVLATLQTFYNGTQGTNAAGAIGYKGWFYHFLDLNSATRAGGSELSSIDTALLLAGVLDAKQFFNGNQQEEINLRNLAANIFNRVDWQWMANAGNSLTHGWYPESGFISYRWIGYSEGMILYVLGLGAATNALPAIDWNSWVNGYAWRTNYGYSYVQFPPLFGHQYSHCWIDFRHIADTYMNNRNISYFENSRRATLAQRAYCIANPHGFVGYSSNVWGLTACDGPGFGSYAGYAARGAPPPQNDDGTLAPTAPGSSLPFAPEVCLPTLRHLYDQYRTNIWTGYGFRDAFNLATNWWDPDVLGIDQGPMLLMCENYRSQKVWNRCMSIPEIQRGLQAAGFVTLPSVDAVLSGSPTAGNVSLTWPAIPGRSYQVEYSPQLQTWQASPTGFITATGTTATWADPGPPATDSNPTTTPQRFYRVFRYGP